MIEGTTSAHWRKSSYSDASGGECVEVADLAPAVGIRDSKHPDHPALMFGRGAFGALVRAL